MIDVMNVVSLLSVSEPLVAFIIRVETGQNRAMSNRKDAGGELSVTATTGYDELPRHFTPLSPHFLIC
jgi:hypothetical protein